MNKTQHSSKNSDTNRTGESESSRQDKALVEKAIGGSEEAHQSLVDKYQRALYFHISKW